MASFLCRVLCATALLLLSVGAAEAQTTTWYFTYQLFPFYTWNGEWSECISGTLTSSSATVNYDGSFLAVGASATYTFYNTSGSWSTPITGVSTYNSATNRFWPSGSSSFSAVDIDGLSFVTTGAVQTIYGPTSNGINLFLEGGVIVDANQAGGDVSGYLNISSSAANAGSCPSPPTVKTWSWLYTVGAADSSWFVCASGHMTSWVGYSNGSYQLEDVQGIRYAYTSGGMQMTGIGGVGRPYSSYYGNSNLIYPGGANGGQSVDAGGVQFWLNTNPAYGSTATLGSGNTVTIRYNASGLVEADGPIGSSTWSKMSVVAWSASAPQCNSSVQIATQPSVYQAFVTYNFIYVISPYFTWYSEWTICSSGSMTFYTPTNSDGSNWLTAVTGYRLFSFNGGTTQNLTITELIYIGQQSTDNKVWLDPSSNPNYPGFYLDWYGYTVKLSDMVLFPWSDYSSGQPYANLWVYNPNSPAPPTYWEAEGGYYLDDASGQLLIGNNVPTCASVSTSTTQKQYNFQYYIPPTAGNNFAVCATGIIQTVEAQLNGGVTIVNAAGTRTVYNQLGNVTWPIDGMSMPQFTTSSGFTFPNDNELYNGTSLSVGGMVVIFYLPVLFASNFSNSYSLGIGMINGLIYEYATDGVMPVPTAGVPGSTWSISTGSVPSCPSTSPVTATPPVSGSQTMYFSYQIAPYYITDGYWSVCASGSMTTPQQQNADYSYTVQSMTGTRVFSNASGSYTQSIVSLNPDYDGADNRIWINQAQNHPPVDYGGLSFNIGTQVYYPPGFGVGNQMINLADISPDSAWQFAVAEDGQPVGDGLSSVIFSTSQSAVTNCATVTPPTVQTFNFYYTQQAVNNSYYVCSDGWLSTWVGNGNGGYLIINVQGNRNFYSNQAVFDGTNQYVFSAGINSTFGPDEWGTNDNYIYPANSGTPGVVDANGLLFYLQPQTQILAFWGAGYYWLTNFIELLPTSYGVYEYFLATDPNYPDQPLTQPQLVTGSMSVWPFGASGVKMCNTTTPPAPFPANLYWAFRYVITPFYTWQGYWSVCGSGVFTTMGWPAADYSYTEPFIGQTIQVPGAGLGYPVIGASGARVYTTSTTVGNLVNTTVSSQPIVGMVQVYGDESLLYVSGDSSGGVVFLSNTNMIYPNVSGGGLDSGGVTFMLDSQPLYANPNSIDFTRVTIFDGFGNTPAIQVEERNGPTGNTEGTISFAQLASATSTAPSAQQCSSLSPPSFQSYSFYYTINSSYASSTTQWQVCASGQMFTNYIAPDGGQVVMEVRGTRYLNYPGTPAAYNPTYVLQLSGMAAPYTTNNNDNLIYPNRPSQAISANGIMMNTGISVVQWPTGPTTVSQLTIVAYPGTTAMYEYGGPGTGSQSPNGFVSSVQIAPWSATGMNPTCKAPYTTSATQTLYFSYNIAITGGSVCASGAITTSTTANSDNSYTALWIAGFRSYVVNGVWTNATITGLGPAFYGLGDQKVFVSTTSLVSSSGLFYAVDNLIPSGLSTAVVLVVYSNGALTENYLAGTATSSSGVVSASPSAVTQCGSAPVTFYAGSEVSSAGSAPPSSSGASPSSSGASPAASSSSGASTPLSSSTGTAGGGGVSNAGGGDGISNGAIAGAVVGSVIGALLLCLLCVLLVTCLSRNKKPPSSREASSTGRSQFAPMEESANRPSHVEMIPAGQRGEVETV